MSILNYGVYIAIDLSTYLFHSSSHSQSPSRYVIVVHIYHNWIDMFLWLQKNDSLIVTSKENYNTKNIIEICTN